MHVLKLFYEQNKWNRMEYDSNSGRCEGLALVAPDGCLIIWMKLSFVLR